MKIKPKYRTIKKIDNSNHKELSPIDYGHLAGAREWGGSFAEVGCQSGVPSKIVKDIYNRFKKTWSPLPTVRPRRKEKITASQNNHMKPSIRRNLEDTFTESLKSGINICLDNYLKYFKEMRFKRHQITQVPKLSPAHKKEA
ncbi:hypothetical protein G6F56_010710 [Rhizopus delemar]|nr:hypothetical protein G6F56_010710 [Rhizopus delemar]